MNNIASTNITNIFEYRPSTLEIIEQSIHNNIDTSNYKTSLHCAGHMCTCIKKHR